MLVSSAVVVVEGSSYTAVISVIKGNNSHKVKIKIAESLSVLTLVIRRPTYPYVSQYWLLITVSTVFCFRNFS